jgi:hypothetical protein
VIFAATSTNELVAVAPRGRRALTLSENALNVKTIRQAIANHEPAMAVGIIESEASLIRQICGNFTPGDPREKI